MPEVDAYAPGTPMWIDLSSPDPEASANFYGKLFGWTRSAIPDPDAGGYGMFLLNGKQVAGVGPITNEGQPPAWLTYVATEDAAATTEKAKQAGGKVLMEPMEVMNAGSMAVLADPTGAVFGLWQPKEHKGAQVVNEPGTFSWNELNTRNIEATKSFYESVFGWKPHTHEGQMPYTEWQLEGKSIAGGMDMDNVPMIPKEVPPHWLTYFTVEDCDATVAAAKESGGKVNAEPMDIDQGRFSVLSDPHGAVFAVIAMPKG
jgi:uncharacterized protein